MFNYTKEELEKIANENYDYIMSLPKKFREEKMNEILSNAVDLLLPINQLESELKADQAAFLLSLSIYTCLRFQINGITKGMCIEGFIQAWDYAANIRSEYGEEE